MDDRSVLTQLEERGQKAPRVDLEGIGHGDHAYERYQILGELAEGKLSLVFRGRDNDIGREVALKVLREEHLAEPETVQRFIEEAQISGQLQHPGILPVYELGLRDDERPYFATRIVKGETLADRLARRKNVREDQRALLTAFRAVCRAVAYAHDHGVIHRDLKPSTIMLGSFGEVMIVDWGAAKVLPRARDGSLDRAERLAADITVISTFGGGDTSADHDMGVAAGTPGYMPPEQAMGRVDDIDEQSDIFSLGAILCEILTGQPAYVGNSQQRIALARRARLEEAHERVARCGANKQLIKICRQCIEPLPKDRPRSIEAVADAVAAWLTASEGVAHRAQLRAVKAEARAVEQRRSRRQTVIVASIILGMIAVGAAVLLWIDADRTQRNRERQAAIEQALQEATRLGATRQWNEALAAAERAIDLGGDRSVYAQIEGEKEEAEAAARVQGTDAALLAELEAPRELYRVTEMADPDLDPATEDRRVHEAYEELFARRFGSVVEGRARLAASQRAPEFAACIGFWTVLRRDSSALEDVGWKALHNVVCALDPASTDARETLADLDGDELIAAAERLGDALPLPVVSEVGLRLTFLERAEDAVSFLTPWQERHPDDYWINVQLAAALARAGDARRAARYAFAAVAVHPERLSAWVRLGLYYKEAGDFVDAEYALRRAEDIEPGREITATALRAVEAAKAEREASGR